MFRRGNPEPVPVTLSHNAMPGEARDPDCRNGRQTGFYPAEHGFSGHS